MRLGVSLAASLLLTGLGACTDQPAARQTPTAAPATADALERRADAVREPVEDLLADEGNGLPHGLDPRPVPIADTLGATELRRLRRQARYAEQLTPQLLYLRESGVRPYLLYRAQPRDTTWLLLDPQLSGGAEQTGLTTERRNLDARHQPEVLLRWRWGGYGSGGGTYWGSHYLLDLTPPRPRLLLSAATAEVSEAFGGYAALHGDTLAPDEILTGYRRSIELRGREVLVGAVDTLGHPEREAALAAPLTPLRPGRYRYQGGRLVWVGR